MDVHVCVFKGMGWGEGLCVGASQPARIAIYLGWSQKSRGWGDEQSVAFASDLHGIKSPPELKLQSGKVSQHVNVQTSNIHMCMYACPGWALCGHDAPPGEDTENAQIGVKEGCMRQEGSASAPEDQCFVRHTSSTPRSASQAAAVQAGGEALLQQQDGTLHQQPSTQQQPDGAVQRAGGAADAEQPDWCSAGAAWPSSSSTDEDVQRRGSFHPTHLLSRAECMVLGMKCKQVIDAGRCEWLKGALGHCQYVTYCHAKYSGENRLLLAVAAAGRAQGDQRCSCVLPQGGEA